MPADDLVLNVRQVAGYPPVTSAPTSASLLLQLAGLGSAYGSISPADLVSTALSSGGDMAIGGQLSAQSFAGGPAQFTSAAVGMFTAQRACIVDLAANVGTIGGIPIASVADVAATVTSFNLRTGPITLWLEDILCAGGAPIYSPRFLGNPRAMTPCPESNSTRLATTAYVTTALANLVQGEGLVTSFNTRTGAIVLTAGDITAANPPYAPLDSPNFSGNPTAPTAPPGTADGEIATTAFVMNAVQESTTGVASFNTRTGAVVLTTADITAAGGAALASPAFTGTPTAPTATVGTNTTQIATCAFVNASTSGGYAPINSPAFTGTPTAPTPTTGNNSTQLATTAYVLAAITAVDAGVLSFNGRAGNVSLIANDISAAGGAVLASPAFTGVPTAPTAAPGTSTTQLATTAFVVAQIAAAGGVSSFNGRAGVVTLTPADVSAAGGPYLPLSGGTMTGAAALVGVTNGANAAAGQVGEYIQVDHVASVAFSNNVVGNITSINLTAGDWDVEGVGFASSSAAVFSTIVFALSTVSNSLPSGASWLAAFQTGAPAANQLLGTFATTTGLLRVSSATAVTVYLVAQLMFASGTAACQGSLRARRAR
jgi:hypothetical protein